MEIGAQVLEFKSSDVSDHFSNNFSYTEAQRENFLERDLILFIKMQGAESTSDGEERLHEHAHQIKLCFK